MNWTDKNGHFWLFGGRGFDSKGKEGYLNDVWEFDPSTNQWVWMGGSSVMSCGNDTCVNPGSYGTMGVPASSNIPGGRSNASTFVDRSGNIWLFGGSGFGADSTATAEPLNDLWRLNPSTNEWTWMGGSSTIGSNFGHPGVYGTLGTSAATNIPGSRAGASSWTDGNGIFWLFGGYGYDSVGLQNNSGALNDLWKFDPSTNEWSWMGGSTTIPNAGGRNGVYGVLGTPSAGNIPGGRRFASTWTDSSGNLWLLGGYGFDSSVKLGVSGWLNDLWEFNPSSNEWAWMGGSSINGAKGGQPGGYGTLGTPAIVNSPGGREGASGWIDGKGSLWLFGGVGFDGSSNYGWLNDLWKFNPSTNEWAWIGGSNTLPFANDSGRPGVYGSLGTPAVENTPGGRQSATSWTDSSGNIWLFGGSGFGANNTTTAGYLTDLWEYRQIVPAATPTFSVASGAYTTTQTVTISDTTPNATIYYTTNGTAPTTSSNVYSNPIVVSSTETLQAIAIASGYSTSAIASATYTFTPPDFSVAINPSSISVQGGQSGATTITITPQNGFNSMVQFSCSGLPSGASCGFSPTFLTPSGTMSTTLTVTTSANSATLHRNSLPLLPGSALAVAFCCFGWRKRHRLQMLLLLAVSLTGLSILNGCGGGGSGSGGSGGSTHQPTISTVTVTATSGSLSHTATFVLTVN
jgi:N-acetylneuraminic acid mutarotase